MDAMLIHRIGLGHVAIDNSPHNTPIGNNHIP
jgi:hypothetical protein